LQYRRAAHVTPKSFISALEGFHQLYSSKLAHLRNTMARLGSGLDKMNSAKEDVGKMRIELAEKDKQLVIAGAEAERLLAEISESTAAAEKERSKVATIVSAVRKKASEIALVKADAQKDLEAAKPALEVALAALNSITQKDIVSLKSLKSPPDVVKRIFDCVLLLRHFPVGKVAWQDVKGSKVLVGSYEEAVRMMGDMTFLQSLLNFPKEAINDETVELLQPYFSAPDFNFVSAKKASGNVAGLCNWAAAMCSYHEVAKAVEPKIIALNAAESELKIAESERAAAESELAVVQSNLDAMQVKLEAAISQKAALEADAAATRRKMENAATLMGALGGEEMRWIEQNATLHAAEHRLIGDCALACAFLSYLGPFNRAYREQLMTEIITSCKEMQLPFTQDLDVSSFLVEDTEAGQWAVEGLPTDPLSIQNGVLVTRASRWPLLVDPQGQGRAWLARRESSFGLRIVQPTDANFQNILEDCLTLGKPLLIENVEESIDPALDAVLERKFVKKGKSFTVMLGDKEVEVERGFKLILASRLPRPRFSPEIFAKVTVIDFTVTPSGLEDQLLGALVLREKRDREEQRRRLVEDVASYRRRVAQLESDLLTRLSTSSGNLLDDSELVDVLAMTKATATEVAAKMASATATRRHITLACEEYRPAAHRAMLLYFIVSDLAGVNCMYQTSLAQFTALYEESIDGSERPPSAAARVAAIASHFTAALFEYIQRGLYERHKLVFAFMIANKVSISAGKVSPVELETFLKLGAGADGGGGGGKEKRKPKEWIPATVWRNILLLADRLPAVFGDLPEVVAKGDAAWAAWYDLEAPEAVAPPHYSTGESSSSVSEIEGDSSSKVLSPFQKLCLLRAFREDRALVAAGQFVAASLGPRFTEPPPTNLEKVWAASAPKCPIVCLLSSGADPTKAIEDLAKRKKIKCFGVSMGQGQEFVARRLVAAAAAEGHWVLLQNAHLGLKYLSEVEQYLAKQLENCHESFRLWITCEPHPQVPIGLLHVALKVTNEAPVGIRAGLRASYQWITQDTLDAVARPEWRTLLFALCFLHSVIQERRKFGPIGWNVPYEFNTSDLAACVQALQNHVAEMAARRSVAPDWPTLRYMVSSIQYGGKITDDRDRELMDAYAEKYFHEEVLNDGYALFCASSASDTTTTVASTKVHSAKNVANTTANYAIPMGTEIDVFRNAIEALPAQDTPELFGLHANADLTFRALQVADVVAVIESTMPKDGSTGSGGESREESVDRVVEGLLTKLPAIFKSEDTKEALKKLSGGATGPLNIHLRQEIERLNKVIVAVAETLRMLRLAIAGTIAMRDDVLASLEAVYAGRPPAAWLKISWESPTLGLWFQGLLNRHDQLHTWLNSGRPKSFWFHGFFNPQGFLTAVKQEVTRKHAADGWALDDVVMVSEVTRMLDPGAVREGPTEGVYIHGLFLEGCSWNAKDGGKLVDAEHKKLFSPLPVLHITAVQARDKRKTGFFEAPCYKVRRRTGQTYVCNFMLSTQESRTKWILRGAALLCSID
jgi:dynein heavy chain